MTFQQSPYLRQQRNFPTDSMQALGVELDKSYIDIAQRVNDRTIGIFPENYSASTGEAWYLSGSSKKQQTLRRVYPITGAGNYSHGINTSQIAGFTKIYGTFTDGNVWYPIPYVNVVAANNQVSITVTSSNIVITAGGGAPPTITSGWVILEYLSLV